MKNSKINKYIIKILHKEYYSFRDDIVSYFDSHVLPLAKSILDPMAGTAPLIPYATKHGTKAFFNDIVPLHYFINRAKTVSVYRHIIDLLSKKPNFLTEEILECLVKMRKKKLIISDKWIPDENLAGLIYAWEMSNRYEDNVEIFIKSVILLCVRPFSSVSRSEKNATWYRPGGMSDDVDLSQVIEEAISKYLSYYKRFYMKIGRTEGETCTIMTGDATRLDLRKKIDAILTSPAYANRYDIVKMYGPELYFLSNLGLSPEIDSLRKSILATNVVSDYQFPEQDLNMLRDIAPKAYEFLLEIKSKQRPNEKDYYLRYFAKYYAELFKMFGHLTSMLSHNGSFYIAVQNSVHRGELNAMDDFIEDYYINKGFGVERVFVAMRTHQGRRNISADHPLVMKKHAETILRIRK